MIRQSLLAVCILVFTLPVFSQNAATPNPGFENWTQTGNYWNPNGWNTLNSATSILGVFTCTRATAPDIHSGTYAIKLTTKSVFGQTANGIASTATLITTPPYGVSGGIPYTERPDSIVGWYKYTPASAADSGFVQFVLLGASNDTIGFVKFNTPHTSVTTFTRFSKAITYFSSSTPVNSYWILSSSDGVNPVVNSSMIIDDIDLIFNSTGLSQPPAAPSVQLLNNVVEDELMVESNITEPVHMTIFDQSGRLIKNLEIVRGTNRFNMSLLPGGVYFYLMNGTRTTSSKSGKLLKW